MEQIEPLSPRHALYDVADKPKEDNEESVGQDNSRVSEETESKEIEEQEEQGCSGPVLVEDPPEAPQSWKDAAQQRRKLRSQPTTREREEHELTHWPYQEWCDCCFRSRARNRQHRRTAKTEQENKNKIPKVAMDFFYGKAQREAEDDDTDEEDEDVEDEDKAKPDLIMMDTSSGALAVWPLQTKSLEFNENDWMIAKAGDTINRWGLLGCDLIWKSDGEPALVAIKRMLAKYRGGPIVEEMAEEQGEEQSIGGSQAARNIMEESPVGEPQSNEAERAVNKYRPMLKTWKVHVEEKIGRKIKTGEPLMKWMKMWTAECYNRTCTGKDGKTAWERMTGRRCKPNPATIGEIVWFRSKKEAHKLEVSWEEGVWLGMTPRGETSIVCTNEGRIKYVWAVRRKVAGQRWNTEKLKWVVTAPEDENKTKLPKEVVFDKDKGQVPDNAEYEVRGVRIKKGDYEMFGYTEGCTGCQLLRSKQGRRGVHTRDCRARMVEAMGSTEEGKRRLAAAEDRWMEEMARRVEGNVEEQERRNEGEEEEKRSTAGETNGNDEMNDAMVYAVGQAKGKPDVSEIYSPPRVVPVAEKMGLKGGDSMDILNGWDFNLRAHRRAAYKLIQKTRPLVLIGSPMCTMFSTLRNMNVAKGSEEWNRKWANACKHMEFVAKLYELQIREGRFFIHENPMNATSWKLPCIEKIMRRAGVQVVVADLCAYGLKTKGIGAGGDTLAKKPTRFMTNAECVAERLQRRCKKDHTHTRNY